MSNAIADLVYWLAQQKMVLNVLTASYQGRVLLPRSLYYWDVTFCKPFADDESITSLSFEFAEVG